QRERTPPLESRFSERSFASALSIALRPGSESAARGVTNAICSMSVGTAADDLQFVFAERENQHPRRARYPEKRQKRSARWTNHLAFSSGDVPFGFAQGRLY